MCIYDFMASRCILNGFTVDEIHAKTDTIKFCFYVAHISIKAGLY